MAAVRELKYKVGDKGESGETITFIYGHSPQVVVFKDSNGKVQWETAADELTSTESAVHRHYDKLYARARECLPKSKKDLLTDDLAHALFLGLSDPEEKKALSHFDAVGAELAQAAQIQARFKYVISGSVTAVATIAVGIVTALVAANPNVELVAIGGSTGGIGAWASILQRASRLELGPLETPAHLQFQGITRILIGTTFGIVAVAAMKAGVLLLGVTETLWTTGLVTFVAGFSERLIPELITRIESREAKASLAGSQKSST